MDIVVDTSVLIAVIINEPDKEALIELTKGHNLITPPSVHWEVSNAFSAMLKRRRIKLSEAQEAINIYYQIPLRFADVELLESLVLASELDIYAYDAYLIRCALKFGAPLLTLDSGLKTAAKRKNVEVMEIP
jgi:predicted nucleic acid-binding protein